MRSFNRALAITLAVVLLLVSTITGLVLPVAAEGDTFKLMYDELYLAPMDSGTYVVYGASPALTMDGNPYTETLTWTTSKSSVASVNATSGRIASNSLGTTVITATNAAGESHSCTVHVTWDGERVAGGHFENTACNDSNRWTGDVLKTGKVITEADGNHCLEIPAGKTD